MWEGNDKWDCLLVPVGMGSLSLPVLDERCCSGIVEEGVSRVSPQHLLTQEPAFRGTRSLLQDMSV